MMRSLLDEEGRESILGYEKSMLCLLPLKAALEDVMGKWKMLTGKRS